MNGGKRPLGRPAGSRSRSLVDYAVARATVMALVDEFGFDPIEAGTIEESWRRQPAPPVYGRNYDAEGVRAALAKTGPGRRTEFTA